MDKNNKGLLVKLVAGFAFLLLIIAAMFTFFAPSFQTQESNTPPTTLNQGNNESQEVPQAIDGESAQILEYTKERYDEEVASGKLVVVYFYAKWCPICREEFPKMQSAFKSLSADKVVGFRVNFNDSEATDEEEEIANEFDIPYQHTKVFIKDGEVILKSPEVWEESRYLREINSAL